MLFITVYFQLCDCHSNSYVVNFAFTYEQKIIKKKTGPMQLLPGGGGGGGGG